MDTRLAELRRRLTWQGVKNFKTNYATMAAIRRWLDKAEREHFAIGDEANDSPPVAWIADRSLPDGLCVFEFAQDGKPNEELSISLE